MVEDGDIVYYTLTFTNAGPTDALNVTVRDWFDANEIQVLNVSPLSVPNGATVTTTIDNTL